MGLLDRLRRRPPTTSSASPDRAARPRPAGTDTLSPTADTLVVYALSAADERPGGRTPCMVVLDFDPVDVRVLFEADAELQRTVRAAFVERLVPSDTLRDPNSRGRLEFVRRWLADHDPSHVGWRLEPAATAGAGVSAAD